MGEDRTHCRFINFVWHQFSWFNEKHSFKDTYIRGQFSDWYNVIYQKLHFDEHLMSRIISTTKSMKLIFNEYLWNHSIGLVLDNGSLDLSSVCEFVDFQWHSIKADQGILFSLDCVSMKNANFFKMIWTFAIIVSISINFQSKVNMFRRIGLRENLISSWNELHAGNNTSNNHNNARKFSMTMQYQTFPIKVYFIITCTIFRY